MIKRAISSCPILTGPCAPSGKKRRRLFAAFLEDLIGEVSHLRARRLPGKMKARPEATTFADACRACRGRYCHNGGNDTYLDENAIRQAPGAESALERARIDAAPSRCDPRQGVRGLLPLLCEGRMQPAAIPARTGVRSLSVRPAVAADERLNAGLSLFGTSLPPACEPRYRTFESLLGTLGTRLRFLTRARHATARTLSISSRNRTAAI